MRMARLAPTRASAADDSVAYLLFAGAVASGADTRRGCVGNILICRCRCGASDHAADSALSWDDRA